VRQIDISVSLVVVVCVVTSFRIRGIRHQTPNTPIGGVKEDEEDILNRTSDTQHPPSLGGAKEDEEDILNRAHKPFV
jgi:hypothetical protein